MPKPDLSELEPSSRRTRTDRFSARWAASYLAIGALTSLGCATTGYAFGAANAKPIVLQYASKDLDCPQAEIRAEEGWGGRWHAVGCGRKASYNAKCDGISCQVVPDGAAVPWEDRPTNDPMWQH